MRRRYGTIIFTGIIIAVVLMGNLFVGQAQLLLMRAVASPLRLFSGFLARIPGSGFVPSTSGEATVIGKRLDRFESILLLDRGSNEGVAPGNRVMLPTQDQVIFIGYIRKVDAKVSQVVLASHPGDRFTAWAPRLSIPIELEGSGADLLRALVPAGTDMREGDEIWYDARLDAFVGSVIEARSSRADQLKEILVRAPFNRLMLSGVVVVP